MGRRSGRFNQTSLFDPPASGQMTLEEFRDKIAKSHPPKQHEKKLMQDIMGAARSLDLPCIHIEYFCGNKFYPICQGTKTLPHKPTRAVCPVCHKPVLAVCLNRINKGLAGHYDILGIRWAIETKHKINKGPQQARASLGQQIHGLIYDQFGVPNLTINETGTDQVLPFLKTLKENP